MLKKAPPLRQDSLGRNNEQSLLKSDDQQSQKAAGTSLLSSSLTPSKTTADALEELRGYKDLREFLLIQGNKSHTKGSSSEES